MKNPFKKNDIPSPPPLVVLEAQMYLLGDCKIRRGDDGSFQYVLQFETIVNEDAKNALLLNVGSDGGMPVQVLDAAKENSHYNQN